MRALNRLFLVAVGVVIGVASAPLYYETFCNPAGPAQGIKKGANTLPVSFRILDKGDYTLCYDQRSKVAVWVYEKLTPAMIENNSKRTNRYTNDYEIPVKFRSSRDDFRGNDLSRGHLAAQADFAYSAEARQASNVYSNIAPQLGSINSGVINQLEQRVRRDLEKAEVVHVVTGPLYLQENGEIRISVTEANSVWIPTHFFKAWVVEQQNGRQVKAYIVAHREGAEALEISIKELEILSGIEFPF